MGNNPDTGRLLKALDEAAAKLEAVERERNEPIAVVGLGCRFPGAHGPDAFWTLLREGRDAVGEAPADRRQALDACHDPEPAPGKLYTRQGGFLDEVAGFDADFFGISPREAASLDPNQRLLLETAWEALEHAGQAPDRLGGSATGVFVGITANDYARLLARTGDLAALDAYFTTGNTLNAAAGRIAYALGLQGPALAVDTACSSSLTATHLAIHSLRRRECDLALAGGVNLLLAPEITVAICQARMLSPDGRCKTFDAAADGYGRGEGCGVVVLKRLADAQAAGDRILALIRASAINQDGPSSGFTVPYGPAQQALIRRALEAARLNPADIDYLEAHGTGTPLGDPIEVAAAAAILGQDRSPERPLLLGSVKTNIGHLEAAAGVAGLIKTVLALHHEVIPPHLHFRHPNPHMDWARLPVRVVTEPRPWPDSGRPHRAGLSAFGVSGSNAHLILEQAPSPPRPVAQGDRSSQLLALAARCPAALGELASRYAHLLTVTDTPLADICFSANTGRAHPRHRRAWVADSPADMARQLAAFTPPEADPATPPPRLAWLFTGQGAQYPDMGLALYRDQPGFRAVLDHCAEILRPRLDRSLLEVLFPRGAPTPLDETAYTQPALFALEMALAKLWQSWGQHPDRVLGHSVGEFAAACVAGVFELEDGLGLIAERGRLMQALPRDGAMAAVATGEEPVAAVLERYPGAVVIAAVNSPVDTVISGRREALAEALAELAAQGMEGRPLAVSHAFHSPLLEPMLEDLRAAAQAVRHRPPRIPFIGNLQGRAVAPDPNYWVEQARRPVRFAAGVAALHQAGCRAFLEIGPKPVLLDLASRCPGERLALPSLRPGRDWPTLLDSLARLYEQGAALDWAGFHRDHPRHRVDLPSYPFQHRRYWPEAPEPEAPPDWFHALVWKPAPVTPPPDWLPDTAAIAAALEPRAAALTAAPDFQDYWRIIETLEALCPAYAAQALGRLGWRSRPGERTAPPQLADQLGIAEPQRRLLGRLLEMLAEAGAQVGDFSTLATHSPTVLWQGVESETSLAAAVAELRRRCPAAAAELTLLERCGEGLAGVLKGDTDPLTLLFPEGDTATAAALYQDSPGAQIMNRLTAAAVAETVARLPTERRLRILEIGAGTGGTSAWLLPMLPAERCDYVYTDISPLFLAKARDKFRAYSFLDYRVLDVEQDPTDQGFSPHGFDLVIAANVLHATRDLGLTLDHVRGLLAPGGLLLLLEGVARLRFVDLIFGLTEGWWRFADRDLRPDHPLLDVTGWRELLASRGFTDAANLSGGGAGLLASQAVLGARAPESLHRHWLVLADAGGLGERLVQSLEQRGDRYRLLRRGAEGIASALQEPERPAAVVCLWGLDAGTDDPMGDAETACRDLLALLPDLNGIPLWLISQGAVGVGDEPLPGLAQSTLWGLARSLTLEQPGLGCRRLDLDPDPKRDPLPILLETLVAADAEDQLAWRGGRRLAPRLVPAPPPNPPWRPRSDGSYLITGALGGLGTLLARRLARRGARHLLLLGRRPAAAAAGLLAELQAQGVQSQYRRVNVADAGQLAAILEQATVELPPLAGVFHAAGVLADGVLTRLDWDRFATVLAPKLAGAWHLHRLTLDQSLDQFVMFGSLAGLLGSPGQGNHAAANAFLDALAHHRRALGLPALTIDWGAWSEVGAAAGEQVAERVRLKGLGRINPNQGLAALEQAMGGNAAQLGIWPVDWEDFRRHLPGPPPPLLAELLRPTSATAPSAPAADLDLPQALAEADADGRRVLLGDWLGSRVRRVLNLDPNQALPPDRPLTELGLDSLVGTELKNHCRAELGTDLPLERLLTGASLDDLVELLSGSDDELEEIVL